MPLSTREACQKLNSDILSKLGSEPREIPCVDEVDEPQGTFKWSEKEKESLKKINSDCNLTDGLEAVLQVAVGAQVMLRRNIDVSSGLERSSGYSDCCQSPPHHCSV